MGSQARTSCPASTDRCRGLAAKDHCQAGSREGSARLYSLLAFGAGPCGPDDVALLLEEGGGFIQQHCGLLGPAHQAQSLGGTLPDRRPIRQEVGRVDELDCLSDEAFCFSALASLGENARLQLAPAGLHRDVSWLRRLSRGLRQVKGLLVPALAVDGFGEKHSSAGEEAGLAELSLPVEGRPQDSLGGGGVAGHQLKLTAGLGQPEDAQAKLGEHLLTLPDEPAPFVYVSAHPLE